MTGALLSYAQVQRDLEEHWPDYRRAFPPIEELSRLAPYAAQTVRAEGETLPGGKVLRPGKLWVRTGGGWRLLWE